MRRTLPLYLLVLALALATGPAVAQTAVTSSLPPVAEVQGQLASQALDKREVHIALVPNTVTISTDTALDLGQVSVQGELESATLNAVFQKNWGLAVVGGLLLVVLALRKGGGAFFPVLATGKGAAWLAVGAGTLAAVYETLQAGGNPTLAVILMAAASGFWSLAKSTGLVTTMVALLFRKKAEATSSPGV